MTAKDLVVHAYTVPILYSAMTYITGNITITNKMDEEDLLPTFSWLAFVRRVDKLMLGEWIYVFDNMKEA